MPRDGTGVATTWNDHVRLAELERSRPQRLEAGRAHTELLLRAVGLRSGEAVLDVACGAGEPALTEARTVGPKGRVVGVDPAAGAIELAQRYAKEENLSHATFRVAAAETLPFPDGSFDCVTSRFGVMYYTDLATAVSEAHRVLRPQGRVGWLAWGPLDQPFWNATARVALHHAGMAEFPPEALQPFRYAVGGRLASALTSGGFEEVRESATEALWSFPGSPDEVVEMWFAGSPPFRSILEALDERSAVEARREMSEKLAVFFDAGRVTVPERLVLATARRP